MSLPSKFKLPFQDYISPFLKKLSKMEYFHNHIEAKILQKTGKKTIIIKNDKIEKINYLLKYAPDNFMNKILDKLENYKKLYNNF